MPGRAVCPALGPGGRWIPWHAKRPPGASDGANEVGHAIKLPAAAGSGAGLVGGALAAGVGHARTVRPDPSTLGVVGERGSPPRELLAARPRLRCSSAVRPGSSPWGQGQVLAAVHAGDGWLERPEVLLPGLV